MTGSSTPWLWTYLSSAYAITSPSRLQFMSLCNEDMGLDLSKGIFQLPDFMEN